MKFPSPLIPATLVKRMKASRPGALLLDGGDTWQGSATALWTNGQDMVDAGKLLGVDVMTGHWEFTYGQKRVKEVVDSDQLMVMTAQGQVIRMPVKGISVLGRNTQGVRIINLEAGDKVTDVARVVVEDEASDAELLGDAANGGAGTAAESAGAADDAGDTEE